MKITLIMVITADGVIARDESHNTFGWNSPEDRKHFRSMTQKIGAIIEGSTTFKAVNSQALKGRMNFVMTRNPDQFESQENVVFISGTPQDVIKQISDLGFEHVALIGGATVNGLFLEAGLVDEILLTIEPKLFGQGLHLSENKQLDAQLELISVTKMNEKGTLLLHYKVEKDGQGS